MREYRIAVVSSGMNPSPESSRVPVPESPVTGWLRLFMALLLALAARVSAAEVTTRGIGLLRLEPALTGLAFSNTVPAARHLTNQLLLDGSGVTLADIDGDGLLDVFFGAAGGRSSLWRNRGAWRFEDISDEAFPRRLQCLGGDVTGVAAADLGCHWIGTTLYGYTEATAGQRPPGLHLLGPLRQQLPAEVSLIAEGGIASPQAARGALEAGADAVVVGTAITGIDLQVAAYVAGLPSISGPET